MVPELKGLTYAERLKEMNLTTLKQRRERGDLIKICKLLNKIDVIDNEELILTEGNMSRKKNEREK